MSEWHVTVALDLDDEPDAACAETFTVTAANQADAEHAALTLAEDAWKPPRRFGVTMGVYHAEAVPS